MWQLHGICARFHIYCPERAAFAATRFAAEDVFSATAARISAFNAFSSSCALMEIDGTPGVAFEAGAEEA
jgi:hypothetical protein